MSSVPVRLSILVLSIMSVRCFAVEEAEPCALAPPAICRVASAEDGCGVLCAGKSAFRELVRV